MIAMTEVVQGLLMGAGIAAVFVPFAIWNDKRTERRQRIDRAVKWVEDQREAERLHPRP